MEGGEKNSLMGREKRKQPEGLLLLFQMFHREGNRRCISGHGRKERRCRGYVWVAEESAARDNQKTGKKNKKG